jgi:hypothetical protein
MSRITVEMPDEKPDKKPAALGIDAGLNRLARFRTGEKYENQAFLKTALKKLRQANKRLHRRKLGSKNREKARRQVARLHYRIACMREDVLQKMTTRLADCYGIIGVETLNLVFAPLASSLPSRAGHPAQVSHCRPGRCLRAHALTAAWHRSAYDHGYVWEPDPLLIRGRRRQRWRKHPSKEKGCKHFVWKRESRCLRDCRRHQIVQPVEKSFYKTHQLRGMYSFISIE